MKKIIVAALLLAACKDQPSEDAGKVKADTGGTAVIAIANNLDYLNGLLSGEKWSQEINRQLFLPLLKYDEKLQLAPLLAASWQMEGDTAVVLQLRNDVKWHDGVKTSAHDVEFTYRYGKDPATAYPNSDYWVGWNGAQVLDSFRIRFSITPQPEPLANLPWIPIMPKHLLEPSKPADVSKAAFNQKPVGNGPFKFVESRANDRYVFEANRDFPEALGGRPNLDRFIVRIIPDETAQEAEITTGTVDLAIIRAERFKALDDQPQIIGVSKPSRQFGFIGWNGRKPPFNDPTVRRALTMAIDRQKLVDVLRSGRGTVAVGPVPPFHWSYDERIKPLPFAPDSARALLKGKKIAFELKVPATNRFNRDMAEMIRSDLANVGVTANVRPVDFATMIEDVTSPTRKFEAVLMAWESDFRLIVHDNFHSRSMDNPFQFASYKNPEVDALLDKLATETSRDVARPLWQRLQTIMRDEQPWTFLFYYPDLFAMRERLHGADMDIRGVLINLPEWWVSK
jgi:peptide/nickel transport system substrate-binding protein